VTILFKILSVLVGLLFALGAFSWMVTPEAASGNIGMQLGSAAAFNTARGDVGGLFLAGGLLVVLGLTTGRGHWLQAAAIATGSVSVGRLIGIVVDGFDPSSGIAVAMEIVMIVVLVLTAQRLEAERSVPGQG